MKLKDLDKIEFNKPPIVAVYRKTKSSKKFYMLVTAKSVDIVNCAIAKKPLIDHKYEIISLGIGQSFIELWMQSHKIIKFDFIE